MPTPKVVKMISDSTVKKEMEADVERINTELDRILPPREDTPGILHEAMRYSTLGGGKRIRGVLCLWSSELHGGKNEKAVVKAACAIELLHAYTLIHDDLPSLDDDDMRRGKPSCHARYGPAIAILTGDALQALAFESILACKDIPGQLLVEAAARLAKTAGSYHLVGGQVADLEYEGTDPTAEKVRFIHENKTAELIATALSTGAIVSGASSGDVERIHRIGRKVGLAFQITDDILDLEGSRETMGKDVRKDSKRGKVTYPGVFGIEEARKRAASLIRESVEGIKNLSGAGKMVFLFRLITRRVS